MSTIYINSYTQAGGWTPASPTGGGVLPHTWLRPGVANFQDSGLTTPAALTDPVGGVTNQGSDGYSVVQATADNRPTLQQVTIGAVTSYVWRCDGTNDFLRGTFAGGAISQPFTYFATAKSNVTTGIKIFVAGILNTGPTRILLGLQPQWIAFSGQSLLGGSANTNWNIWSVLFNNATSQYWHNGTSKATGQAGANTVSGITIGDEAGSNFQWNGDIGQILIYPGNLSTADKNQVGEWLEIETGITWTPIT